MENRLLGTLEVSALGLGCMGMSGFYGPANTELCIQTIRTAFENGITLFDTADVYGFGENEDLVGKAIAPFRDKVRIATKFGVVRKKENPNVFAINGQPEYVRQQCENSLKRLGINTIDLYYLHHVDPSTPIETTIQAMAQLVVEGKVRHLGLGEMSADHIRRAHAVHPITAVQWEYSLIAKDAEDQVFPLCKELNIGCVACSPIGRGFLSGTITSFDEPAQTDSRRMLPRFFPENCTHNYSIVTHLKSLAHEIGCSLSQLVLSWVTAQSPCIVPLFGTTKSVHVLENIKSLGIHLSQAQIDRLNEVTQPSLVHGSRHPESVRHIYKTQ